MPGAVPAILDCLQGFGLHWDGEVHYQSRHLGDYSNAIARLQLQQQVYTCSCSRKRLNGYPGIYPGFCRNKKLREAEGSLRVKAGDVEICFDDRTQGRHRENIAMQHGDFIIRRKDGIIAYQLAVVIDDHLQRVNQVVRGFDLLDSTAKQIYLHSLLGYPPPAYMHVPVIVDNQGNKLSKQTCAQAVDCRQPAATLFLLLSLLKQNPPAELRNAAIHDILEWAISHWQPEQLKKIRAIEQTID